MNLVNTNRLRITLNDARRHSPAPGFCYFRSNDHDRSRDDPRLEQNWSLAIGRVWLFVKWRPNGKSSVDDLDLYGKGEPRPLSVLRASYEKLMRRR
jgi:hypothetical protein